MNLRVSFLCWLFMVAESLSAQSSFVPQTYTAKDGLPSTSVYNIYQDSRSFLWISTQAGLSRFDGNRFVNYSVADGLLGENVIDVAEDAEGNIWVATSFHMFKLQGSHFSCVSFRFPPVRNMISYQNKIWIGTKKGLYVYKEGEEPVLYDSTGVLLSDKISRLRVINKKLYVGTSKGINIIGDKVETFGAFDGYIMDIAEDEDENIWVSTLSGKVACIGSDKKEQDLIYTTAHPEIIRSVMFLDHKQVLLMRDSVIDVIMDGKFTRSISGFNTDPENSIVMAIVDREGNIWMATTYGLIALRPTKIKQVMVPERHVFGIFHQQDSNNILVSNGHRFFVLTNDSLKPAFTDKPRQLGEVNVFAEDGPLKIFGSTLGDLLTFLNGKYEYLKSLEGHVALCGLRDETGLYFGSMGALIHYNNDSFVTIPIADEKGPLNIHKMIKDGSKLLLATQRGLFTFDLQHESISKVNLEGYDEFVVHDIIREREHVLITAKGYGILILSKKQNGYTIFKTINSAQGISDYVNALLYDVKTNRLWTATQSGLFIINHPYNERILVERITAEDGLQDHTWGMSPLQRDDKGNIYVGGSNGLAIIRSDALFTSTTPVPTYITEVTVNRPGLKNRMNEVANNFFGIPPQASFTYNENDITFSFIGVNLFQPHKMKYEYVLEGLDMPPTVTTENSLTYYNLRPGDYTFKVRSTTNQQFSEEPFTSFQFSISKPFWETYWFLSLIAAVLISVIILIFRVRLKQKMLHQQLALDFNKQLNESKILAIQARMNPHFIFNSLNSIQYFISRRDPHAALSYLSRFGKLLRQILDNTLETKISLRNEISMLRSYIEMEQMRFENKFSYKISVVDDDVDNIEIPGMLIQPFVENAIIHGLLHKKEEGLLTIAFSRMDESIKCVVSDNGIGRAMSAKLNEQRKVNYTSQATKIATNRLELFNKGKAKIYKIEIEDRFENDVQCGTMVTLYLPKL